MNKQIVGAMLLAAASSAPQLAQSQGSPVTITNPFFNLENDGPTPLPDQSIGQYWRIGATTVIPNGAAVPATTGVAASTNLLTGTPVSTPLYFDPGPAIPDFYEHYFPYNSNSSQYFGPWTLTFTNGSHSASAIVTLPTGQQQAPFIQTATITGSAQNPTFNWTPPSGAVVDGYRINIYQNNLESPTNNGLIYSFNSGPGTTSFTVPTVLSTNGYTTTLSPGTQYSLQIDILQTKDGSTTNQSNGDLAAISRTWFEFTPQATQLSVYLPVESNGVFMYNIPVVAGQTYTIDPFYASGYHYAEGVGGPNFSSVLLPAVQSNPFTLTFQEGGHTFTDSLSPDTQFFFPNGGVSAFTVTGIDAADHIAPGNTTAFQTTLSFVGSGTFDGTQVPIVKGVPEPPTYICMLGGAALLLLVVRKRSAGGDIALAVAGQPA